MYCASGNLLTIPLFARNLSERDGAWTLSQAGPITAHTRPVEALDANVLSQNTVHLCTGDTMGAIKLWEMNRDPDNSNIWRCTLQKEFDHHRTRINELHLSNGLLWSGKTFLIPLYSL